MTGHYRWEICFAGKLSKESVKALDLVRDIHEIVLQPAHMLVYRSDQEEVDRDAFKDTHLDRGTTCPHTHTKLLSEPSSC